EQREQASPPAAVVPQLGSMIGAAGGAPPTRPAAYLRRADSGGEIALDRDLVSLGRSAENNVVLPGTTTSRRHALIQRQGERFVVDDLDAANGTFVNGERIS